MTEKPAEKKEATPSPKQTIKKGDFIEIDYIGQLKEDQTIFDTTDAGVAKKEGFFSEDHEYGPAIICVGENNIVKGIDKELEGKQTKTEYVLDWESKSSTVTAVEIGADVSFSNDVNFIVNLLV